jgi:hypothetical protein
MLLTRDVHAEKGREGPVALAGQEVVPAPGKASLMRTRARIVMARAHCDAGSRFPAIAGFQLRGPAPAGWLA